MSLVLAASGGRLGTNVALAQKTQICQVINLTRVWLAEEGSETGQTTESKSAMKKKAKAKAKK